MIALRGRAVLRAIAREPLVHFVVLGAAMFVVYGRVARPPPERVVVPAAFVKALGEEHRERTGRTPDAEEERRLVARFVDEELLYREALALGLDRSDLIVRRRLVQKMELLARARVREPETGELAAFLAANEDRYRAAEVVSFRHVFVSRERHGAGAGADVVKKKAEELLAALRDGADAGALGDPFVLGASFARRTRGDLETAFGATFAVGALEAPPGEWSGPISSTFGEHLVRVEQRAGGRVPELAAVRSRVREDLLRERREAAVREEIARLRGRYRVEVEEATGR